MISLLQHKCDLLSINHKTNETIANIACRLNREDMLKIILSKQYPQKLQNYLGQTLLHIACVNGLQMLKFLASDENNYDLCEDINLIDSVNELTPLQYACKNNDVLLFEKLLGVRGCDPDTKNKSGNTVLHVCCEMNAMEMVSICKSHTSLTIRNGLGDTPLHIACSFEHYDLVRYLLEEVRAIKLDGNINKKGQNILHVVAKYENGVSIIKYLIERKICDHRVKQIDTGNTALHIACSNKCFDNVAFLLTLDYDGNSWYNQKNESPPYRAFISKSSFLKEVVMLFEEEQLHRCLKTKLTNSDAAYLTIEMPLIHCLLHRQNGSYYHESEEAHWKDVLDIINKVIQLYPSFITSSDSHGNTILHYLASCPNVLNIPAFDRLVNDAIKSNINLSNASLSTPLHSACSHHTDWIIMKILDQHHNGYQALNQQNASGLTPAELYDSSYSKPGLYYLIAHGAKYNYNITSSLCTTRGLKSSAPSIGIIVVGNSSVGKTTLIKTLEKMITNEKKASKVPSKSCDTNEDIVVIPKPTTGIETCEFKNFKNGNSYKFYDFAGQIEFETVHSTMLENLLLLAAQSPTSPPFVFFLLVKGTDPFGSNKQQIDRWFSFARRHVKVNVSSVHIVIICSHEDCFKSDTLRQEREQQLRKYVNNFDTSPLVKHEVPIFLNGLKPDTAPLNKLLDYLEDRLISCDFSAVNPNPACYELTHYLPQWFPDEPFQVKDIIDKIKDYRQFELQGNDIRMKKDHDKKLLIPQDPDALIECLKLLHVQNSILLIMKPIDVQLEWWVIDKKMCNALFSKVASIFSPDYFEDAPHDLRKKFNTGIIPSEELSEVFSRIIDLDADLIQDYLICMEFYKIVDDEAILSLITDCEEVNKSTEHLFFPGLISKEKSITVYQSNRDYTHYSGWQLKKETDFGLRFLHSLLLSLTFKFSSKSDSNYHRRLSLWKTGIFWLTSSGVEVLVEVIEDQNIIALFRCTSEQKLLLSKHRSEVLREIREVQNRCNCSDGSAEYYFHPPPHDYECIRKFFASEECNFFALKSTDLAKCFKKEPEHRLLYISNTGCGASEQASWL